MSDIAVSVRGLGKEYRIGRVEAYGTFRDTLTNVVMGPVRRLARRRARRGAVARNRPERLWALRDVSFDIRQGEVVGIIGRNGAGKTTLLKLLSRVTEPTEGMAEIHGRIGSLLEVGTGFHPELTGRENIFLNGAILGMKRAEIRRRFDEIVSFAQVERFIDTPVKRFSSGMYLRLAFAVAAHLEPEILVVDEVLAVGDDEFQKRCLSKMESVAGEGRTVLFVSHNMGAVRHLCTRGILLNRGQVSYDGPVDDVVNTYLASLTDVAEEVVFPPRPNAPVSITRLCIRNAEGKKTARFTNTDDLSLEIEYDARERLVGERLWMVIDRVDGVRVVKSGDDDGGDILPEVRAPGRYVVHARVPGGLLNAGVYRFRVVIGRPKGVHHDDRSGSHFEIEDVTSYGKTFLGKRNGVLRIPIAWSEEKVNG